MSNSVKATLKMAAAFVLCLTLGLALMWGVVGCGDEDSTSVTTVQTDTSEADGTDTSSDGDADGSEGDSVAAADLVGKWYSDELKETLEFSADGKMTWTEDGEESHTFEYKVEMGAIVFTQPNAPEDNTLPFSIEGDTLTTDDTKYGAVTYTRQ